MEPERSSHSLDGKNRSGSGCKAWPAPSWANVLLLQLEIVNILEQEALHLYFVVGPANYVCGPNYSRKGQWSPSWKLCLKWLFKSKQARPAGCGPWASQTVAR